MRTPARRSQTQPWPAKLSASWGVRALASAATMLLAAGACIVDRTGERGWREVPSAPVADAKPAVDLYFLGGDDRTRASKALAQTLPAQLSETSAVIWLGSPHEAGDPCPTSSDAQQSALATLSTQLDKASVFAVGNPRARACDEEGPASAGSPDAHFLIDIGPNGARVHTPCYRAPGAAPTELDAMRCTHPSVDAQTQVRLVLIDESLWFNPDWDNASESDRLELAELDAIVNAIPEAQGKSKGERVPHILVSHYPIESEGTHGQGGWRALATYRHHPESVQRALADGRIQGVVAGLEANLQYTADLGLAVKRSSRVWLDAPVFQVVSGAAGDADARHRGQHRASRRSAGIVLKNDRFSQRVGFAHVHGDAEALTIDLHARFAQGWRVISAFVDPRRPAHPARTPAPTLAPCRDCDPVQGAADSEKNERRVD